MNVENYGFKNKQSKRVTVTDSKKNEIFVSTIERYRKVLNLESHQVRQSTGRRQNSRVTSPINSSMEDGKLKMETIITHDHYLD